MNNFNASLYGGKLAATPSFTVKIVRDDDPMNPRKEWDNFGTMACWHRRYNLGDIQPKEDPAEWLKENAPEGSVVLALYLYDHGGITMSASNFGNPFSCMFDSGAVGYIVATPEKIKKEYNVKRISKQLRNKVIEMLKYEVKVYDDYLTGNVWGYEIEDGEETDSSFGFYGDTALDDMKDNIDKKYHHHLEEAWNNR